MLPKRRFLESVGPVGPTVSERVRYGSCNKSAPRPDGRTNPRLIRAGGRSRKFFVWGAQSLCSPNEGFSGAREGPICTAAIPGKKRQRAPSASLHGVCNKRPFVRQSPVSFIPLLAPQNSSFGEHKTMIIKKNAQCHAPKREHSPSGHAAFGGGGRAWNH